MIAATVIHAAFTLALVLVILWMNTALWQACDALLTLDGFAPSCEVIRNLEMVR